MNGNEMNKTCPGCGKHCCLNEPSCEKGRVFAETGALPERDLHCEGPAGPDPDMRGPGHGFGEGRHGHGPRGPMGRHNHHGPHGPHAGPEGRPMPDAEAEGDIDAKLAFHLRSVAHMMRARFDDREGQRRILLMLNDASLSQRDLTRRLGIQPGSASEILSKLESGGLITRTPNEEDRRTTDIRLTDAGKELAGRVKEERRERRGEMFSCLTEEDKEALVSLLEKLRSDWENRR